MGNGEQNIVNRKSELAKPNSEINQYIVRLHSGIYVVRTPQAPEPIGPYEQAKIVGSNVFYSGQVAIDPKEGRITAKTIEDQTEQVLDNLEAVMRGANQTWMEIGVANIFLDEMTDFPTVNEIYGNRTGEFGLARATVAVKDLPKPKGERALVEISLQGAYVLETPEFLKH